MTHDHLFFRFLRSFDSLLDVFFPWDGAVLAFRQCHLRPKGSCNCLRPTKPHKSGHRKWQTKTQRMPLRSSWWHFDLLFPPLWFVDLCAGWQTCPVTFYVLFCSKNAVLALDHRQACNWHWHDKWWWPERNKPNNQTPKQMPKLTPGRPALYVSFRAWATCPTRFGSDRECKIHKISHVQHSIFAAW